MNETASLITREVCKVAARISEVIETVKSIVMEQSVEGFVKDHVKQLALIGTYHKCFKGLNVNTRQEAEQLWEMHLKWNEVLEDAVDQLLDKENEFDQFLQYLDHEWKKEKNIEAASHYLETGDKFPKNVKVLDESNR